MSKLDDLRARLDAQQAAQDSERDDQETTDLEALISARDEHGPASVCAVSVPFTAGLPTMAIARRPKPVEFKRFQDQMTKKDAGTAQAVLGAEQLAAITLVYPDAETFAKMADACPGVRVALGSAAAGLASAKVREDQK